ncbi:MAG: hypothetical protein ABI867_22820 [Kofleriaceae bacterium]
MTAQLGYCEASSVALAELRAIAPDVEAAVRTEPAIADCIQRLAARVVVVAPSAKPAAPTCEQIYFEPWVSRGLTRGAQQIKEAHVVLGYEKAPQRCAEPANLRLGLVLGVSNMAQSYTVVGGEVEYDRWYDGYYGVRGSVLLADGNSFLTLGLRAHTRHIVSFGLDAIWMAHGPSSSGRTGGNSALGILASIGLRGRTVVIVSGVLAAVGALVYYQMAVNDGS